MKRNWTHDIGLRILKLINILVITCPFELCWHFYYATRAGALFSQNPKIYLLLPVLFIILYVIFGRIYNAFLISYYRLFEMVYSQMLAACISDGIVYFMICILCKHFQPIWPGLLAIAGQFVFSTVWSLCSRKWYFRHFPPKKTYVIYDTRSGIEEMMESYGLFKKYAVDKVIPVSDVLSDLQMLDDVEEVFLSGIHSHDRNTIIKYCIDKGIEALVLPRIGDAIMLGAKRMHIMHLPVLQVHRYNPKPEYVFTKRFFDIVLSFLALIVTSPVMLIFAVLIKLTSKGPVIFKQERLGKNGKVFVMYKFRSMCVGAEKDGVYSDNNDVRVTKVGKIIRATSIDELPQLVNILKGDMSFVGPRPPLTYHPWPVEEYSEEQLRMFEVRPGITGWAQIHGRKDVEWNKRIQMNVWYVDHVSFPLDLKIFFTTIGKVFTNADNENKGATVADEEPKVEV
jgi:exopolysaccharide biosynthesis polyprenyl glycosylphosphotransferase